MYVIGFALCTWMTEVPKLMKNREYEIDEAKGSYTLTTTGQVICVPEYCCRLANNSSVHVVLL